MFGTETLRNLLTLAYRLAGSDTTGISLRSIFYYLLHDKSTYKTLQNEIDEADRAGKLSPIITFSESLELEYL
jgi:cytochrome P450